MEIAILKLRYATLHVSQTQYTFIPITFALGVIIFCLIQFLPKKNNQIESKPNFQLGLVNLFQNLKQI